VPPVPVVKVLVQEVDAQPLLTGLCAGFEQGSWRAEQLAGWMFADLPSFALKWSVAEDEFRHDTARRLMLEAAHSVYATDKYRKRGEFGELLLHAVLRHIFGTEPAVSKLYYKDAANDTVKGFDSVHVLWVEDAFELWLGEVKFYTNISSAIRAVIQELEKHTDPEYLRSEFLAITHKIDPAWPPGAELKRLLDSNTSLDEVFPRVTVPVLLTYDSPVVRDHASHDDPYTERFREEILAHYETFAAGALPSEVTVHLILVPLNTKELLVEKLQDKLLSWQGL
jgi:hypothetical protein